MSIIAGIYCRAPGASLPEELGRELKGLLSRRAEDRVEAFAQPQCILLKVDVQAYGAAAFWKGGQGSALALAGDPGLDEGSSAPRPRSAHVQRLGEHLERDDWTVLRGAQGTFCGAHYHGATRRVSLMTDKLGVRGLYYWVGDRYVVFASALRILEAFSVVDKRMDLRAVTEMAALGYALGDRTPYGDVVRLRGGERATFADAAIHRVEYWRWDEVSPSARPEQELLEESHKRFVRAVAQRAGADGGAAAFLSGGLDSRCVVAALRGLGLKVHTYNFSLGRSLDENLAHQFAAAAQTVHQQGAWMPGEHALEAYARLLGSRAEPAPAVERPHLVWSGDGGSVGVGHVYVDPQTVALLKSGQRHAAVAAWIRRMGANAPLKLLRPEMRSAVQGVPAAGIEEELARLSGRDPVRQFHIFLLLNDQRWHLHRVYEDLDLNRMEMQLPFFDGAFLESVLLAPSENCLGHRFYNRWLAMFPPEVRGVPWQHYPGHEPCPLPLPPEFIYQWGPGAARQTRKQKYQALLSQAREVLASFPSPILRKPAFQAAVWLHRLGLRDYGYAIRAAAVYHRHWGLSAGRLAPARRAPAPPG